VVVADIGLPEMTGWDLLRRLRRKRSDLPAIAMSGYGTENDRGASRDAGFAAHLTKPVNGDALIEAIGAVIAGADQLDARPAIAARARTPSAPAAAR
jgi:DNA-binding response OmpR family regulator